MKIEKQLEIIQNEFNRKCDEINSIVQSYNTKQQIIFNISFIIGLLTFISFIFVPKTTIMSFVYVVVFAVEFIIYSKMLDNLLKDTNNRLNSINEKIIKDVNKNDK